MREKRFLVEGSKNVQELINSDFIIDLIVGSAGYLDLNGHRFRDIRQEVVREDDLSQLGSFKTNESVLAVARMKDEEVFNYEGKDHLFYLDGISDPGNMGTIIRTLDWFGFSDVACSKECAEFYHPKVISGTMGSFTRVRVHSIELTDLLHAPTVEVLGADMHGKPLDGVELSNPCIIIMGSESHGLSEQSKKCITNYIAIPRFGHSESLNVGVATGIIANHLRISK